MMACFILSAFVVSLPLAAEPLRREEPIPRREANVSIRNEVQLAIDQGLAHLQSTQRADGTWGGVGTTGYALMALQRDPRGRGVSFVKEAGFEPTLQKGYAGLRAAFPEKGDLRKMENFGWNVPPAVAALRQSQEPRDMALVARARQAIGLAPIPELAETRALFLALDPRNRAPAELPAPLTGSAIAAWGWLRVQHFTEAQGSHFSIKGPGTLTKWLSNNYTLERNPDGEGVHQYYFWLSSVLERSLPGLVHPELKLSNGETVDIPRQLAEKLINEQNGNGSWSGVGEHWTEKDPDLVTAMCLLALEQVYGQL